MAEIIAAIPALLYVPVLGALGFTPIGPVAGMLKLSAAAAHFADTRAGGLAAGFQAVYGTPCVSGVLQSAAMGGAGSTVLNGSVWAAAVAGAGAVAVARPRFHWSTCLESLWPWRTVSMKRKIA